MDLEHSKRRSFGVRIRYRQQLEEIPRTFLFSLIQFQNKLKAVVYTYIASQLYSNKDKEVLLKAFREMDKDGNGVIGKE